MSLRDASAHYSKVALASRLSVSYESRSNRVLRSEQDITDWLNLKRGVQQFT